MGLDKIGIGHMHRRDRSESKASNKSTEDQRPDTGNPDDETVVDEQQGNVLSHIIAQLRPGADLNKVTLPTFILEPRSMLERITNFMAHPETLLPMPDIEDPVQRFVSVVKFYLSGWHIKPPGVKKPMNPILGETFYGWWDYSDGTRGYYIAEQTSHHPPKSSYFFMAPEHNIRIDGTLKPRSKFLGNSAASLMEGIAVMTFLNRHERYFVTQPNMYARGILFGKMKYELGDHSFVRCPELGLMADIEFKTKGYFSGGYDAFEGHIKEAKTDRKLFELSGKWNGEMFIKDLSSGHKQLLFDASSARATYPSARPLEEQEDTESQRLWYKVTTALKQKNHDVATEEKSKIEDQQREEATKHAESDWRPRLFRKVRGGPGGPEEGEENLDWIIDANINGKTPREQVAQILSVAPILPKQMLQGSTQQPFAHPQRADNTPQQVMPRDSAMTNQAPYYPPIEQTGNAPAQGVYRELPMSNQPNYHSQREQTGFVSSQVDFRQPAAANQTSYHLQGDQMDGAPSLAGLNLRESAGPTQAHPQLHREHLNSVPQQPGLPGLVPPMVQRPNSMTSERDVFIDAES